VAVAGTRRVRARRAPAGGNARRRRDGDLERFKQLIENRGEESGARRGEVQDGESR